MLGVVSSIRKVPTGRLFFLGGLLSPLSLRFCRRCDCRGSPSPSRVKMGFPLSSERISPPFLAAFPFPIFFWVDLTPEEWAGGLLWAAMTFYSLRISCFVAFSVGVCHPFFRGGCLRTLFSFLHLRGTPTYGFVTFHC